MLIRFIKQKETFILLFFGSGNNLWTFTHHRFYSWCVKLVSKQLLFLFFFFYTFSTFGETWFLVSTDSIWVHHYGQPRHIVTLSFGTQVVLYHLTDVTAVWPFIMLTVRHQRLHRIDVWPKCPKSFSVVAQWDLNFILRTQ